MKPPTCDDPANALLPWHVNGSLEGEEAASVHAHLERCPVCAREVRELVELAAMASLERPEVTQTRTWSRTQVLAVAAAVLLPIVLGVALAIARPWSGTTGSLPAPALQLTARLDLGSGPVRGSETFPRISIPPGTERVAVSLLLPVVPEGPLSIQLRGPSGKLLTEAPATPDCVRGQGCTYTLPASMLTEPGPYAFVFVRPGTPVEQGYSYPFTVGARDDR
jgi:hypothetical protein